MLRVLSEVCHTYLCECLARGMTAFLYVYYTPNKFIYCSCKVHNNYAIMNSTVIPYILIIFCGFFSFLRDPMLIFYFGGGGVIFIFMFHNFAWFIWYS